MFITGAGTKGLVDGCDIAGNRAVGVEISDGADPTLSHCK